MIRFGLIGLGRWGRNLAKTLQTLEHAGVASLRGICSSQPDAPEWLPPEGRHYTDPESLISSGIVDAVIIATPPRTHSPLLRLALDRRMPTIVEKPLTLSLPEAEALRDEASRTDVPVLVDYIHLFHPAFRALREAIANERILAISSEGGGPGPVRPDYPALWDYGPHDLSLQLALSSGERPRLRSTRGTLQDFEVELKFPSGTDGRFRCGNTWPAKRRVLEVTTLQEIFRLEDGPTPVLTRAPVDTPAHRAPIAFASETPLAAMFTFFAKGVVSGSRAGLEWNLDFSVMVTRLLEQIEMAIRFPRR